MKLLFSIILVCLIAAPLSGCLPKQPQPQQNTADALWLSFQSGQKPIDRAWQSGSSVISGSLRFGLPNDTRRVTFMLWSSNAPRSAGQPLPDRRTRLEVNAGAGASICSAVFEKGRMTVLLHQEQRVFTGRATRENLEKLLGIPLPMDVIKLNDFLNGFYVSALDAPVPHTQSSLASGGALYHIEHQGKTSELELDALARPVRLRTDDGWDLVLSYGNDGLPLKMDGQIPSSDGNMRFLLLVKNRAHQNTAAFNSQPLELPQHYQHINADR